MASDLIKYGAIAVGGYFVLKYLGIDLFGTTTAATTPVTTTNAANPNAASASTTKQLLVAKLVASHLDPNSYQTVDFWNYYYKSIRGIDGPAPESLFPNEDRNKLYSIDEWWSVMTGQGFSGLGEIAHFVNPYQNVLNTAYGSNLSPRSMERYIVNRG